MNFCTEELNLSFLLLSAQGTESVCSCISQVLETNTAWKIDIDVLFIVSTSNSSLCCFIWTHHTALLLKSSVDIITVHFYRFSHANSLFFVIEKDVCKKDY